MGKKAKRPGRESPKKAARKKATKKGIPKKAAARKKSAPRKAAPKKKSAKPKSAARPSRKPAPKTTKPLPRPQGDNSLVLRTDFSDDSAWNALCVAMQEPQTVEEFRAHVECVSDPTYAGLTAEQLLTLAPKDSITFAFLVDQLALTDPEHPILVVDLYEEPGRTFRVIPREMWGVENNLSIANMDFREFADNVEQDGVFRGFP